jgi:putative tryptophan/tyrosine transport system substrate-binding protein
MRASPLCFQPDQGQQMQFDQFKRREFIRLLGGAAATWPLVALGQQPGRLVRIGFLSGGAGPNANVYGFQHGLRQLGYVEGQNLVLIYRWAESQRARVIDLARELLELNVDVLASHTTEAIAAVRSLNTTIPVVMTAISDPIGNGLVASLARPGGNTTGVTLFSNELAGKRLQVLKEVVPQLTRVALLAERDRPPTATLVSETQAAAHALRLALQTFEVRPEGIAEALRSIEQERADAVIVQQNLSFTPHLRQIADLAISYRLPTIHPTREFVEAGGLLAYGPSLFALGERAAWYVDRILKGTKPADLPVEQPTKFELILNLKTAKALGLDVPPSLLAIADGVID